jgi:hypothetical protein
MKTGNNEMVVDIFSLSSLVCPGLVVKAIWCAIDIPSITIMKDQRLSTGEAMLIKCLHPGLCNRKQWTIPWVIHRRFRLQRELKFYI